MIETVIDKNEVVHGKTEPLCPVFGECGGCRYQDIAYEEELRIKEEELRGLYLKDLPVKEDVFSSIVASPKPYHYRNRLDLRLLKTKNKDILIGFSSESTSRMVPVESCPIAQKEISDFLPQLKAEVKLKLPAKYRIANLVVRCGDEGKVHWGGVGRRSLRLKQEEYFSTEVEGRKIFYSLDTFFQANLSILPALIRRIKALKLFDKETVLYDLYGGVGFFGVCFADMVRKVILIEENIYALKLAQFNIDYHRLGSFSIFLGRVEEKLPFILSSQPAGKRIALLDPPRAGIKEKKVIARLDPQEFKAVLYLSCQPQTQVKDLKDFLDNGWQVDQVIPFDFFPKTKHTEVLTVLKPA